jgi:predicted secreted protein
MKIGTLIAIYFVVWCIVLFAILPLRVQIGRAHV